MPHFRSRRSGTILNVSSAAAFHSFYGMSVYSANKIAFSLPMRNNEKSELATGMILHSVSIAHSVESPLKSAIGL